MASDRNTKIHFLAVILGIGVVTVTNILTSSRRSLTEPLPSTDPAPTCPSGKSPRVQLVPAIPPSVRWPASRSVPAPAAATPVAPLLPSKSAEDSYSSLCENRAVFCDEGAGVVFQFCRLPERILFFDFPETIDDFHSQDIIKRSSYNCKCDTKELHFDFIDARKLILQFNSTGHPLKITYKRSNGSKVMLNHIEPLIIPKEMQSWHIISVGSAFRAGKIPGAHPRTTPTP